MDRIEIQKLKELNNEFYQENHISFSLTRNHAWDGWKHVLQSTSRTPTSILDVACGNMRFKAFLDERFDLIPKYYGVDSCAALVPDAFRDSFQELDIIDGLLEETLEETLMAPECDLTVCFGFMHHVPSYALRASLMRALVGKTVKGGVVAVSFWQFAQERGFRERALRSTLQALEDHDIALDEGDYLLGWQNKEGTFRYCHSFAIEEIMRLVEECGCEAKLIDRFNADGRTESMNAYVILRKT